MGSKGYNIWRMLSMRNRKERPCKWCRFPLTKEQLQFCSRKCLLDYKAHEKQKADEISNAPPPSLQGGYQ